MNQKDLKLAKKRLSYVGDPLVASFEPKRYKIGQETAELWPIYQREVRDSSEYHLICKRSIGGFI